MKVKLVIELLEEDMIKKKEVEMRMKWMAKQREDKNWMLLIVREKIVVIDMT